MTITVIGGEIEVEVTEEQPCIKVAVYGEGWGGVVGLTDAACQDLMDALYIARRRIAKRAIDLKFSSKKGETNDTDTADTRRQ